MLAPYEVTDRGGGGVLMLLTQDSPRPWNEIPGVVLVGVVVGIVLLIAAIRGMFGRKDK